MSNTWQRIKQILGDALELEPSARSEFLAQRCAHEPELRHELDELILEHEHADLLSTAHGQDSDSAVHDDATLPPGTVLGPYEIVRELGRGGAGAVFLAQRKDHFRKLVAIKLLFPHFRTSELTRRFQVERQILATLEHPSIARLLDGGVTPSGEPYLVIEYIEGLPLDEYTRVNRLSIRQRLELFRRVCDVVDYAHRRLIVHRDLKPANILVTAEGEPKLLDFGIAKLLDPGAITRSAFELTRYGLHPMTPEYASPEQARGERVTTASDVYSLGVLLYLVLAGRLPYKVGGDSLHALIASISTQEPARIPDIPPDLEAVTLRSLEKEAERRYASAAALSDDLRNWLEERPVQAARGTQFYHVRKFVRRHVLGVTAAAITVISLSIGLGVALHQRQAAVEQRDRAEAMRVQSDRRLKENQRLAHTFLFDAVGKLAAAAPNLDTRRNILTQAGAMLDRLAAEAGEDPEAAEDLAQSYLHLSALQSDPAAPGPADAEGAQDNALHAQRILARRAAQTQEPGIHYLLALCYVRLGDAYFFGEEYQGSGAAYHESVRRLLRLLAPLSESQRRQLVAAHPPNSHVTPEFVRKLPPRDLQKTRDRMGALNGLGEVFLRAAAIDQSAALHAASFDYHRPLAPQFPHDLHLQVNYACLLEAMADHRVRDEDPDGARTLYLEAARVYRSLPVRSASDQEFQQSNVERVDRRLRARNTTL